jgi:lipopolysaccharide/colanic/teichoic acid biosynthesis glycosyltransferase
MTPGGRGEAYCRGRVKRAIDAAAAAAALVVLAPLLALLAAAVLLACGRPVLFRQERVGLDGRPFRILKFRTMRPGSETGLPVTGSGDDRVTPLGRFLRAAKLDELPQFVNVLRGHMSLVGPRPEIPRYVAAYTADQRRVLHARPGLTDPATLRFVDEERLLGSVPAERRERFYLDTVLPRKLALNLEYLDRAGPGYDARLILETVFSLFRADRA